MRVWVVEACEPDDRHVVGVYATAKAARMAHPVQIIPSLPPHAIRNEGGWQRMTRTVGWHNGLRGDLFRQAIEYEVKE